MSWVSCHDSSRWLPTVRTKQMNSGNTLEETEKFDSSLTTIKTSVWSSAVCFHTQNIFFPTIPIRNSKNRPVFIYIRIRYKTVPQTEKCRKYCHKPRLWKSFGIKHNIVSRQKINSHKWKPRVLSNADTQASCQYLSNELVEENNLI